MPKVTIAFDRDLSRVGKTVEVSEAEARVLISEGRARLAGATGNTALRRAPGPTRKPPLPEVKGTAADVRAAQNAGQLSDAANAQEAGTQS